MEHEWTIAMTYHARVERAKRVKAIAQTIGITRPILEYIDEADHKRYQLTTKGIVLVLALNEDRLITAFMANINQVSKFYHLCGKKQVSPKIYKVVQKNLEKYSYLLYIQGLTNQPQ